VNQFTADTLNSALLVARMEQAASPSRLRELTAALARGDDAAWSEFHRDYGPGIFRYLLGGVNESRDPRTKLLAETLHGDWADGPAATMALRAAAHARRRRAVRGATAALGVAAMVAVFVFAFATRRPRPPLAPTVAAPAKPGYEIISDDELIALLKDRPLLVLPQENGAKRIVLLDR